MHPGLKLGLILYPFLVLYSMTHVLQWNMRGFRANATDLQALIASKTPAVVALQETKLKQGQTLNIHHYKSFRYDNPTVTIAHGGVALLVHYSTPSTTYQLRTNLQAVAATVDLADLKVTIVSIYIPPAEEFPVDEFDSLVRQLPRNYIIMGDFNAHNSVWGCTRTNRRGRRLEEVVLRHDLCILNSGHPTHIALPSGTTSAIDLSLCSASVGDRFRWRTHSNPCGSDHYPIWLWSETPHPGLRNPHWNLRRADWESFTEDCVLDCVREEGKTAATYTMK